MKAHEAYLPELSGSSERPLQSWFLISACASWHKCPHTSAHTQGAHSQVHNDKMFETKTATKMVQEAVSQVNAGASY